MLLHTELWWKKLGKDRLLAVVRAAQNGHEFAYNVLIKHLRGAVYDVHRRKISSRITSDEWYSDGLEVLIKCVRKFDTVKPRAKFSTYFITALTNHATDLVRSYYTAKSEFEKTVLSENNDESGNLFNLGTDTYNPEQLYILRELLHTTDIAKTEEFKKMVRQLLGIESHNSEISSRRFEQMQYRFKKAMKIAISELS